MRIGMGCKAQAAANGPCHWQGLQRRRPPKSAPARPRRDRKHVLTSGLQHKNLFIVYSEPRIEHEQVLGKRPDALAPDDIQQGQG